MIKGLVSTFSLGNHAPPKDQLDDETVVFNIEDSSDSFYQPSDKPPNDGSESLSFLATAQDSQSSNGSRREVRIKCDSLMPRVSSYVGSSNTIRLEDIFEYAWPDDDLNDETDDKEKDYYIVQEMLADFLQIKSFKRKYRDLARRTMDAYERHWLHSEGYVSEAKAELGLTALRSDEVLSLLQNDYPDIHVSLVDLFRSRKFQLLAEKQRKNYEAARIERTEARAEAARRRAIESAFEFNRSLVSERRRERRCYWDLQTMQIHFPRPAYIDRLISLKSNDEISNTDDISFYSGGAYPVAVIPGQFSEHYISYSPDELAYLPLSRCLYTRPSWRQLVHSQMQVVLNPPVSTSGSHKLIAPALPSQLPQSPIPVITTPQLPQPPPVGPLNISRLHELLEKRKLDKTAKLRMMQQQDVAMTNLKMMMESDRDKERARLHSCKDISNNNDANSQHELVLNRTDLTACGDVIDSLNKRGLSCIDFKGNSSSSSEYKNIVSSVVTYNNPCTLLCHVCRQAASRIAVRCTECGKQGHPRCLDLPETMLDVVQSYAWSCMDCKRCIKCLDAGNEEQMMFCDRCDRGYHAYCVGLTRIPDGQWECPTCHQGVPSGLILGPTSNSPCVDGDTSSISAISSTSSSLSHASSISGKRKRGASLSSRRASTSRRPRCRGPSSSGSVPRKQKRSGSLLLDDNNVATPIRVSAPRGRPCLRARGNRNINTVLINPVSRTVEINTSNESKQKLNDDAGQLDAKPIQLELADVLYKQEANTFKPKKPRKPRQPKSILSTESSQSIILSISELSLPDAAMLNSTTSESVEGLSQKLDETNNSLNDHLVNLEDQNELTNTSSQSSIVDVIKPEIITSKFCDVSSIDQNNNESIIQ